MGIIIKAKTNRPATLKLYNQINTYLFEQEYMELRDYPALKEELKKVRAKLAKIF